METLIDFLSLQDANVRFVLFGCILLSCTSAVVGTFTFVRKRALVGDAVAHAILPGVCLSFLFTQQKDPWLLLIGAFISGWISLIVVDVIVSKTKLKEDSAIAIVLSVFFAFGIVLLTHIQHTGAGNQAGLDKFLFGSAASLVGSDLYTFFIVAVVVLVLVVLFYKEFKLLAFDKELCHTMGLPVRMLELVLVSITVLAIVIGIQAVGVVLMAAMLITPAAAARFWTDRLLRMIGLAVIFAAISGAFGAYVSYLAPSMPTGPWIVIVISAIALFSFFFAPAKGIISKQMKNRRNQRKVTDENILKAIYQIGSERWLTLNDITNRRPGIGRDLYANMKRLDRKGLVERQDGKWQLTKFGERQGRRVLRLHRLWEVYLTQYLNIASDHVHEDAESIEHVITPELEKRLEQLLDYPTLDPHGSEINYDTGKKS